jgi:indole-3-glycerol phosphate synthase
MDRPMTGTRRFSQAISEGDGISVIAKVDGPEAAQAAESQGAEAVAVVRSLAGVREATSLPLLWCLYGEVADAKADGADAYLLSASRAGDFDPTFVERRHAQVLESGLDCVVEVSNEEDLAAALERVDPEIVLLTGDGSKPDTSENVLDKLADVPAGKLVIAHLDNPSREEVLMLERVGIDGVLVNVDRVVELVGEPPPEV